MSLRAPAPSRWYVDHGALLATGLCVLSVLVRLPILGQRSLGLDEVLSVKFAALDWPAFVSVMWGGEANMLPYYLLLRGWLHVGDGEFAIRLLSVIPSAATVPLIYVLGTRLFDRRTGIVSAALLSLNAFDVRYAQQARSYSLVTFLVTLATLCFVEAVERRQGKYWVGVVCASVIAVYAQFLAGLVLVAYAIALLVARPRVVSWWALAVSSTVVAVLVLPVGYFVLAKDTGRLDWVRASGISSVRGLLFAFAGGSDGAGWLYLVAGAAAVALNRSWFSAKRSAEAWHLGLTLCWLIAPILVLLAVSYVKPMFVYRYLIIALPPYLMLVALGMTSLPSERLFAGAVAVMLLVSTYRVVHYYQNFVGDTDWRSATRYVLTHAENHDALVFYIPATRSCFEYYYDKSPAVMRPDVTILPADVPAEVQLGGASLKTLASRHEQIWLIVAHASEENAEPLRELILVRYALAGQQDFGGIQVGQYRLARDRPPRPDAAE
jgi:mannosyltransferase